MNALGVDYASSSDEDDNTTAVQQQPVVAPAPTAPAAVVQTGKTGSSSSSAEAIEIDGLPSEPPGAADPDVQARIARLLALQQSQGGCALARGPVSQIKSFQENLQTKKEVANPYILGKVVEYFGIDELQTNFSSDVFDPYALPLHEYSEKLSIEQKKRQDERLLAQQQRSQIAFTYSQPTT